MLAPEIAAQPLGWPGADLLARYRGLARELRAAGIADVAGTVREAREAAVKERASGFRMAPGTARFS